MPAPTRRGSAPSAKRGSSSTSRRRPTTSQANAHQTKARQPESDLDRLLDEALARTAPDATDFAALGVPPVLVTALARRGITTPFPIQARALPDGIAGRDVLGRAQTGTGKTLAFGLPMVARLASRGRKSQPRHPRGLVLAPTRELAMQVADGLRPLADSVGLKTVAVFGGTAYGRQLAALDRGIDIVVATPGRLIDLIDRGACTLADIEVAVLDEADHMADLGFMPAVVRLLDDVPPKAQHMLFSATLDRRVAQLVSAYLTDPAVHAVAPATSPVEDMDHRVFLLDHADKVPVAAEIARRQARTLLFVRTKHGADRLAQQLTRLGIDAAAIHGNLSQNARQRALAGFAAGQPRVLVATDVVARGIHVDDVDLVVHFDPPNDATDYLHRSGRTARAGATGTVVSFVLAAEQHGVAQLHRQARVTPTAAKVRPGHDVVREIAESGEPIAPVVRPSVTERTERRTRPHQPARRRRPRRTAA